jgi:hypothetical protein
MNPTSEKELRELDSYIAEHVFGCKPHAVKIMDGRKHVRTEYHCRCETPHFKGWNQPYKFTTDPAAAMMVLERCCEKQKLSIGKCAGNWVVESTHHSIFDFEWDKSLPLAICLLAKQLFTPPPQPK